jgi:hypothetical protein
LKTILGLIQSLFNRSGQSGAPEVLFDIFNILGYVTGANTCFTNSYLTISGGIGSEVMYTAIAAIDKANYLVFSAPSTYTVLSIKQAPVLNLNKGQVEQMLNYIGNNF